MSRFLPWFTLLVIARPALAAELVIPPDVYEGHTVHTYYMVCPESPDGRFVVLYASTEANGQRGEVRLLERATGKLTTLATDIETEDIHRAACQQWAGGGDFVVYHAFAGNVPSLKCYDIKSGATRTLAANRLIAFGQAKLDVVPVYSPHWAPGDHPDLELINARTGKVQVAVTAAAVRQAYPEEVERMFGKRPIAICFPAISPDGKRVFFKLGTPGGGDFRSRGASQRKGLVGYDLESKQFLFMHASWGHPAWHPDSRRIINIAGTGLVLIDGQDGTTRPLVNDRELRRGHPSFSSDGKWYATDDILAGADGNKRRWGVFLGRYLGEPGARPPERIAEFDNSQGARSWRPSHPHPSFSPDGKRLYFNQSSSRWTQLMVQSLN